MNGTGIIVFVWNTIHGRSNGILCCVRNHARRVPGHAPLDK